MIKESAIKQDGKVFTGKRHHNIIKDMVRLGIKTPINGEQGFVTDDGKFVSRKEAAKIALESGQIKKLKFNQKSLFSEDLY